MSPSRVVPLTEARATLSTLLTSVISGPPVLIGRNGRAVAVLVGIERFADLLALEKNAAAPGWAALALEVDSPADAHTALQEARVAVREHVAGTSKAAGGKGRAGKR